MSIRFSLTSSLFGSLNSATYSCTAMDSSRGDVTPTGGAYFSSTSRPSLWATLTPSLLTMAISTTPAFPKIRLEMPGSRPVMSFISDWTTVRTVSGGDLYNSFGIVSCTREALIKSLSTASPAEEAKPPTMVAPRFTTSSRRFFCCCRYVSQVVRDMINPMVKIMKIVTWTISGIRPLLLAGVAGVADGVRADTWVLGTLLDHERDAASLADRWRRGRRMCFGNCLGVGHLI